MKKIIIIQLKRKGLFQKYCLVGHSVSPYNTTGPPRDRTPTTGTACMGIYQRFDFRNIGTTELEYRFKRGMERAKAKQSAV